MKTLYASLTLLLLVLAPAAFGAEGQEYLVAVKGMT